jgi:hypothetical protein
MNNPAMVAGGVTQGQRPDQEGQQRGVEAQTDPIADVVVFHTVVPVIVGLSSGFFFLFCHLLLAFTCYNRKVAGTLQPSPATQSRLSADKLGTLISIHKSREARQETCLAFDFGSVRTNGVTLLEPLQNAPLLQTGRAPNPPPHTLYLFILDFRPGFFFLFCHLLLAFTPYNRKGAETLQPTGTKGRRKIEHPTRLTMRIWIKMPRRHPARGAAQRLHQGPVISTDRPVESLE